MIEYGREHLISTLTSAHSPWNVELVVWFTKQLYTQYGLVQVCPPRPQFTYSSFPLLTFAPEGIPRVLAPFLSVLPLRQHGRQYTCILDLWPKDVRIVSFPDHKPLRVPDSHAFESFWLCANHHHHGQYSLRFHIIIHPWFFSWTVQLKSVPL